MLQCHHKKNGRRCTPSPTHLQQIAMKNGIPPSSKASGCKHSAMIASNESSCSPPRKKGRSAKHPTLCYKFYPALWKKFLDAAKAQNHLDTVLNNPFPSHDDGLTLAAESISTMLTLYHNNKKRLETGYYPKHKPGMVQVICSTKNHEFY